MMAQTSPTDATLVAAARDARDLVAFAELVRRYQDAAFAVALSVVRDRALAEDATQETFLRAWASLDRLRDPTRVAPWLCGIARNVARSLLRDRSREVLDDTKLELESDASPLRQLMEREADVALSELLGRVPNRYRAPMVLHYAADQSVSQIAQCLARSESNVKKLLSRGRELLRERAERFTELTSACRVPATLAVAIIATLGARSAAASTATAGAITTLATTGVVVKKSLIIVAAVVVCLASFLGYRLFVADDDAARAAPASAAHATATPVEAPRPAPTSRHQLSGVVLDDRTAAPLPGATVLVSRRAIGGDLATTMREHQQPPLVVVADAAGRFAFELAPGQFYVDANLAGYTSARPAEVEIRTADVERLELRLVRGGVRVHGTVTDIQGGAIAGAIVTAATAPGGIPNGHAKAALTGKDGTYELWLAVGTYDLEAEHAEYAPVSAELAVTGAEIERDLQLVPGSLIEGVVLDRRDAKPVAGAIVFIDGKPTLGALTDDDGRFRIAHLAAGTFALGARAARRVTLTPNVVELDIGETRTNVELWLDRAANVSGRVVGEDGRPVAGVQAGLVRWTDQLGFEARSSTGEDGRFEIDGVAPGSYGVIAQAPDRPRLLKRTGVEVGDQDVGGLELVVKTAHVVTGRVVPARLATITLVRPMGTAFAAMALGGDVSDLINLAASTTRTRPDGSFEIAGAPSGSYTVVADADDGTRGEANVVVGRDGAVTIDLAATPTLRGTIVDRRGKPVANLQLHATSEQYYPNREQETLTDAAGKFVLRGFAPGDLGLSIVDARCRRQLVLDGKPGEATTTITLGDQPTDVRLVVTGCDRTIRGIVVDRQGAGVADAWVHLESDDFRTAPMLTDASGRFTATGLHDGQFIVTAYHPVHGRGRLESAGAEANHRVELRGEASLKASVRLRGQPAATFELRVRGAAQRSVWSRDPSGSITVGSLTAGRYTVEVRADAGSATGEVVLDAGATGTIELELREWAVVRGTLVGADDRPLAGHVLTPIYNPPDNQPVLSDELLETNTATTDRDGRFELRRVAPNSNVLVVSSPSGEFSAVLLKIGPGEQRELGRVTVKFAR